MKGQQKSHTLQYAQTLDFDAKFQNCEGFPNAYVLIFLLETQYIKFRKQSGRKVQNL